MSIPRTLSSQERRFSIRLFAQLFLLTVFLPSHTVVAQCTNRIELVPLPSENPGNKSRDFVRFRYPLTANDSLLIRSHEDTDAAIGSYDTGFVVTRDGQTTQSVVLRKLPEFRREDESFADSFSTLAITRACSSSEGPTFFITMSYQGDDTSAVIAFTIVPSNQGYEVSTLPMFNGGVLEVSAANPRHLRTWTTLFEGTCNACETRYRITNFELRGGKPIRTWSYRTHHLYTSGNAIFDDRRRIRFIP